MLLQAQSRIARDITMRSERNDARRAALAVLGTELRALAPADVHALSADSIAARIFRGHAVVCGFDASDTFVRYRGLRLPDPAKDSALQLGVENVVAVDGVRTDSSACVRSTGEEVLAVRWAAPPRVGASWLLFESGSYHLSTYALRYRRAGDSRQPVTNEVFDDRRSAFAIVVDSVLRRLDVTLYDRYGTGVTRASLPLSNRR